MKDIIFLVVLLLFSLIIPIVKEKAKKSQTSAPTVFPPTEEHEYAYEKNCKMTPEETSVLEKKSENFPKMDKYFTYDSLGSLEDDVRTGSMNSQESNPQIIDNEEQSKYKLTLSADEIYKGFIYSEILKRRVN